MLEQNPNNSNKEPWNAWNPSEWGRGKGND